MTSMSLRFFNNFSRIQRASRLPRSPICARANSSCAAVSSVPKLFRTEIQASGENWNVAHGGRCGGAGATISPFIGGGGS